MPKDLAKNLKPCPSPSCRKYGEASMDINVEQEGSDDAVRHRLTCRRCSFSSGWFESFHEMVAWWNKYARMPNKKKEQ